MKFTIKLTKTTTENAEIEIEADNQGAAEAKAEAIAEHINNALGGPAPADVPEVIEWDLEDCDTQVMDVEDA